MSKPDDHTPWWDRARHAARRDRLIIRNTMKAALRAWFAQEGFTEVDCGALVVSPGNETHLHAFETTRIGPDHSHRQPLYLHTSPEFACKKLLAAGETAVFTFAPSYRNCELGPLHVPEFTMLEWYRTEGGPGAIQRDCDAIMTLAARVADNTVWRWRDRTGDVSAATLRCTVAGALKELFAINVADTLTADGQPVRDALAEAARNAGVRIGDDDGWSDIFSKLMVELEQNSRQLAGAVTPDGHERALLVDHYPACQSPLARLVTDDDGDGDVGCRFAHRFELFVAGVELANGYGESNDGDRLRAALEAEMNEKARLYGTRHPIDDGFIDAVSRMPAETAGCAMGFDRLVMLATSAGQVTDVMWTPPPVDETA